VVERLTLLLRIREVTGPNLGPKTGYIDWRFSLFSSVPPGELRDSTYLKIIQRPLPSISLPIHHLRITLSFNTIYSLTEKASLNYNLDTYIKELHSRIARCKLKAFKVTLLDSSPGRGSAVVPHTFLYQSAVGLLPRDYMAPHTRKLSCQKNNVGYWDDVGVSGWNFSRLIKTQGQTSSSKNWENYSRSILRVARHLKWLPYMKAAEFWTVACPRQPFSCTLFVCAPSSVVFVSQYRQ
jgi:hypothetical protein